MEKKKFYFDMDGVLAEWQTNIPSFEALYEKGYFLSLSPMKNIVCLMKDLMERGCEVYVLTSYLTDSKYAKDEKRLWLKNYIPELPEDRIIYVHYGDHKSDYVDVSKDSVLFDDYTVNLMDWMKSGGVAIKVLNGVNNSKGTWKGLCITQSVDVDVLLNSIGC